MAKYNYVVFTNPAEGHDEEFNTWYDEVHLGEVCAVPGVNGAVRYAAPEGAPYRYLALYEIEGDGEAVVAEISRRSSAGEFRMTSAMGGADAKLYRQITPKP